ncbi:MAG: hypothetical protein QW393_04785 [Candidatus Micrarchaeaceae archaeon]
MKGKMKTKILILALVAWVVSLLLVSTSAAQGPETEMNVQIIGYDTTYGLYVTAPLNQSANMIQDFEIILHSPGASTYSLTENGKAVASGQFSYLKTLYFNTTFNGTVIMDISLYSSALAMNQTFQYILDFMTAVEYISYLHSETVPKPTGLPAADLESGIAASVIIVAILVAIRERERFEEKMHAIMRKGAIRRG